jgi:large conductance mechanosensitive channel
MKKVIVEFKEFLKEYKIVGLATAFIIGVSLVALIQSLVNNIIMPLITPFIPNGAWQNFAIYLGPIVLRMGAFFGAIINFLIIALVVFFIAKSFFKEEKVAKK